MVALTAHRSTLGSPRQVAAIVVAALAAALAGINGSRSLGWIDRVFPGFAILDNRVIQPFGLPNWRVASLPAPYLAEVVAMDGVPVSSGRALYAAVERMSEGHLVGYTLRDGRGVRDLTLPTQRFTTTDWLLSCGVALFMGVVFVASVVALLLLAPRDPVAGPLLVLFGGIGCTALSLPDTTAPPIFLRLAAVGCSLLPVASWNAALAFPAPHALLRFQRASWVIAALLVVAFQVVLYAPQPFAWLLTATFVLTAAIQLGWSFRVLHAYWAPSSRLARQRAQMFTLATSLGLGLPAIVTVVSAVIGGFSVSPALSAFTAPIIPVSLAYAIVKHDLFEIDALVKRGTYYLVLTGLVAVTYAAAVAGANWLLHQSDATAPALVALLCALVVLLLLNPVRTRLQRTVDRVLFGARYDGAQALAEASRELAGSLDRQSIAAIVDRAVQQAIPNGRTRLFTLTTEGRILADALDGTALPPVLARDLAGGRLRTAVDAVEAYADPAAHEATRTALGEVSAAVAVPVLLHGALVGVITVGRKRAGLYYTAADGAFLVALMHAVAIALQNAESFRQLAALNRDLEARVQERTRDLESAHKDLSRTHADLQCAHDELVATQLELVHSEKMVSLGRLAAGVAHEVNNPMSFVTAAVEPLQRRLERAMRQAAPEAMRPLEEARELVDIMARGAERAAAIVTDLRAFATLQEAERRPVDLPAIVEQALRLSEARWQGRITIHRDYGTLPAVDGDGGQLHQVFLNLIANACDAIAGTGNLWLTARDAGTEVTVTVEDDGAGIAPEHLPRLFEPFFSTKPVGQGSGLGLAVSHGIVAAHGGRLEVERPARGGALFRVSLPVSGVRSALHASGERT
jgi:signal transduction histidine kinase